ncbi:MAG: hypothetical protein QM784_25605 [Polyangiaceae bacterium]
MIEGKQSKSPEVYYPDAIAKKLAKYGELREITGLTSVATCEEARRFMSAYLEQVRSTPERFAPSQDSVDSNLWGST